MLKCEYLNKNYHLSILTWSFAAAALEYCPVIVMEYLVPVQKLIIYKFRYHINTNLYVYSLFVCEYTNKDIL